MGFMPGYIYHTNEIIVSLGENIFAKRTAEQARGIAKRRIDCIFSNKLGNLS